MGLGYKSCQGVYYRQQIGSPYIFRYLVWQVSVTTNISKRDRSRVKDA